MARQKHQPWQQAVRNFTLVDIETKETEEDIITNITIVENTPVKEVNAVIEPLETNLNELDIENIRVEKPTTENKENDTPVVSPESKKSNKKVSNLLKDEKN